MFQHDVLKQFNTLHGNILCELIEMMSLRPNGISKRKNKKESSTQ